MKRPTSVSFLMGDSSKRSRIAERPIRKFGEMYSRIVHVLKIAEPGEAFLIKRRQEANEDALLQLAAGIGAAIC